MKLICQITAGSRLYGLETPESDVDLRGVFLNTKPSTILGLEKNEIFKKESIDSIFFEFRHFLKGLKKTNTQMMEMLFAESSEFSLLEPEFIEVKQNKDKLIDSKTFFKSLMGYIYNEKRLANGERTGQLGGKRKNQLDKYGFSPKNFSHLFRLAYCGSIFFETGFYPVNLKKYDSEFRNFIFEVKTKPEKFNKDYLNDFATKSEEKLKIAFQKRNKEFTFDSNLANKLCHKFYMPFLGEEDERKKHI